MADADVGNSMQRKGAIFIMRWTITSTALVWAAVAAACSLCISGCRQSASGEFNEYNDAEEEESAKTQDQEVESPEDAETGTAAAASGNRPAEDGRTEASGNGNGEAQRAAADPGKLRPPQDDDAPERAEQTPATPGDPRLPDESTRPDEGSADRSGPVLPQADPQTPAGDGSDDGATAAPRKVQVLVKDREFHVEGPDGAWRVSYDDLDLLKVLNMEPVTPDAAELMPQWLKDLDGRKIRIRGFMYPPLQETGLTGFALARDNQICCFGRDPKIYDVFVVRLKPDVTTDYIQNRPFDVVGVFHIDPVVEGGEFFQLYRIDEAIVIDR